MKIIPELLFLNRRHSFSIPISRFILFGFYCLILCQDINAQSNDSEQTDSTSWNYNGKDMGGCSIGDFISDVFTPRILADTKNIRAYIRDERFQMLRLRYDDMRAVDAIYLRSLKIADYQVARALFLSFLAVLEHLNVEVKLPILRSITVPLSFEAASVFYARIEHLPTHIYAEIGRAHV
jgi:hypothetical protein